MKKSSDFLCFIVFFSYFLMVLRFAGLEKAEDSCLNTTVDVPPGVVLDKETLMGKMSNSCMSMALAAHRNYNTRLLLNPGGTDVVYDARPELHLLNDVQVEAVIGLQDSVPSKFIEGVSGKANVVMTVSSTATNPSLSSRTPCFIRILTNGAYLLKDIIQACARTTFYCYNLIDSFKGIDDHISHWIAILPPSTKDQFINYPVMRNKRASDVPVFTGKLPNRSVIDSMQPPFFNSSNDNVNFQTKDYDAMKQLAPATSNPPPKHGYLLSGNNFSIHTLEVGMVLVPIVDGGKINYIDDQIVGEVSMLVPNKNEGKANVWILFKPMTWDLWLACGVSGTITVLLICINEARMELQLKSTRFRQNLLIIWAKLLALVTQEGEPKLTKSSGFILLLLVFETGFLSQAYFATLPSVLTSQQPTITDVIDLFENEGLVGYRKGSDVVGLLKQLKLDESKLRAYSSSKEYNDALKKGRRNGGVGAIFEKMQYIKHFLKKYPKRYTMVGPTYWKDEIAANENNFYWRQNICPAPETRNNNSDQLSLIIFWGFFLVTGTVKLTTFLAYRKWHSHNSDIAIEGPAIVEETTTATPDKASSDGEESTSIEHDDLDQTLPASIEMTDMGV